MSESRTAHGAAWTLEPFPEGLSSSRLALLRYDVPGRDLNVLTEDTLRELDHRLTELQAGSWEGVAVVSGKAAGFVAGADVDAIRAVETTDEGEAKAALGQGVLRRLATLGFPSVAAIHGACLGGGLELALWCTGRVATSDERTRLGLPEVRLGIVPGFGGTQRLPAVVGLAQAVQLATTGRQLSARAARRVGLVDATVHPDHLLAEAAAQLERLAGRGRAPERRRTRDTWPLVRDVVARVAGRQVARTAGERYPAPAEIVRLCRLSLDIGLSEGLTEEARTLGRLVVTPTSRALLHVFGLTQAARRGGVKPSRGALLGVVGGGVMGAGIAAVAVTAGLRARVKDVQAAAFGPAARAARDVAERAGRHAERARVAVQSALDRLSFTLRPEGFRDADLVVEAVVERADVKRAVLAEMAAAVGDHCLLATNTSSLPVAELAAGLARPERFAGLHFFNPVPQMPLVEVVPGPATSPETVERLRGWAQALGKHPVVVKDSPGFLVNRLLMPYLSEAFALHGEGVALRDVDDAARRFGMPMGPFRLLDEIGLDVARHAAQTFAAAWPERFRVAPILDELVDAGELGRKSGRGFFDHGGREPRVRRRFARGIREVPAATACDRLFLSMANEAVRCLAEGVAASEQDVDLATVFGMGFPAFRGGLCRWMETEGRAALRSRLEDLAGRLGPRFVPAVGW